MYLAKMSKVSKEVLNENLNSYVDLEYNTKVCLNNMFLIIINNYESEEFRAEFIQPMYSIEYNSFLMIKLSLDLSIVPIKK